ncbi:CPBP family intramembrane glutamic endopeptidase [Sporosarcina koreensis]|uniref:CPBP family intramembrane glutamic endopeptidase n=2 Tax=Sporosarcina koreensis TaxID=334735 RepID=A0ABW0TVN0_9BACL
MIYIGLIIFNNVPITFLLFYGWLLFVPLIIYMIGGRQRINLKKHLSVQSLWVGLTSGIIFFLAIFGGITILKDSVLNVTELKLILAEWNFTGNLVIWLMIFLIAINPLLEEYYWREFMYNRLLEKVSARQTMVITSFFYSLYHLLSLIFIFNFPFNVIAVFPVFIAGIIWAYLRFKLKSITASIISHSLADLGIMMV